MSNITFILLLCVFSPCMNAFFWHFSRQCGSAKPLGQVSVQQWAVAPVSIHLALCAQILSIVFDWFSCLPDKPMHIAKSVYDQCEKICPFGRSVTAQHGVEENVGDYGYIFLLLLSAMLLFVIDILLICFMVVVQQ